MVEYEVSGDEPPAGSAPGGTAEPTRGGDSIDGYTNNEQQSLRRQCTLSQARASHDCWPRAAPLHHHPHRPAHLIASFKHT
ncbi:unnamed protein product [Arctia plantaginis]|uniref:Uncharacterized protein n=1 Tax=Arctia plantaginis TaxID=874455 RepID=A0A8S1A0A9_ARCPL|nr:unnamed protein product [Arctia plantaginis]